jgi:CRP-like cAMP-binding protein
MYYLFDNVSDYKRKELLKNVHFQTKTYKKGECIFNESDLCNYIGFIKKGSVVAKNIMDDNHEISIRELNQSDSFGEGLIFSKNPTFKATFISREDSEITYISKEDLLYLFKENQTIMLNVFEKLNRESQLHMKHIKLLSLKNVKSKVACYFYLKAKETNNNTFNITLNKTEIASYLNIERPTFSKELNYLIKERIISYSHKVYTILNQEALLERI